MVKVLRFDTLLQVLILKVVRVAISVFLQPFARGDKSGLPQSHGSTEAESGATVTPPSRVFCKKSAEVIENKGREPQKERQESLRVRKRKEIKEIEEVREVRSARFVRDNTRNGTVDAVRLSIVNLSSTLRRAYGGQAALLAVSASLAVHGMPAFAHDDGCQAQSR